MSETGNNIRETFRKKRKTYMSITVVLQQMVIIFI